MKLADILKVDGRVRRIDWWRVQLLTYLAASVLWVGGIALTMAGGPGWAVMAPTILLFIPAITFGIRRLHDRNRSGWWLIPFNLGPWLFGWLAQWMLLADRGESAVGVTISLAASLVSLGLALWGWVELGFLKGARGPNRFGAEPR